MENVRPEASVVPVGESSRTSKILDDLSNRSVLEQVLQPAWNPPTRKWIGISEEVVLRLDLGS